MVDIDVLRGCSAAIRDTGRRRVIVFAGVILFLVAFALVVPADAQGSTNRRGQIQGVVIDAAGEPVPVASVRVLQSASHAFVTRAATKPDGSFRTEQLSPGSYV
jgi:hypothetical protein